MNNESDLVIVERNVDRNDPESQHLYTYVFTKAAYDGLGTEGSDPKSLGDDVLRRNATRYYAFDALGRMITEVEFRTPETMVFVYSNGVNEDQGSSEAEVEHEPAAGE